MPKKKSSTSSSSISSITHNDKRANIPTEELRDFVADDERTPKKMMYPRDPSLDPQLVWKGKDEQDQHDLEVPVVPVYIQEKINPHAIIENVRAEARKDVPQQANLFADFNGIEFEELIDFYHHEQNWTNRTILGDSLLVMTSLAEKEGLKGKVQTIYFDPPYGIKFGSNWQVSTRKRDVKDGKAEDTTRQPEQIKAFRDTWELGIHSYLSYLRDRFVVCRDLLTESGSLFVQIGDENVHLVRNVLDEVFGSENFISSISFTKTSGATSDLLSSVFDIILWFSKNRSITKYRQLLIERDPENLLSAHYQNIELPNGERRPATKDEIYKHSLRESDTRLFALSGTSSQTRGSIEPESFIYHGTSFSPETTRSWSTTIDGLRRLAMSNRLHVMKNTLRYIRYVNDSSVYPLSNLWSDTAGIQSRTDPKVYVVQTATNIIERCLLMTTDPGDLVLDPTCGSGTTAYVAEQWGRRWITIDTSRVAIALARTRFMAAKYPYYLLADSREGMKKEMELTLTPIPSPAIGRGVSEGRGEGDIKKGFVYKRVPHITLKSIANNEEIDIIHAKWQKKLEPIIAKLSKKIGKEILQLSAFGGSQNDNVTQLEEWQIPRDVKKEWSEEIKKLHEEFWQLKRARQKEIHESISRRADMETLYDQPYEDNKRIRVSGPFTVESLSPHRVLSLADENMDGTVTEFEAKKHQDFSTMIIDNLRKAGVQNTFKNERLKFDRLESFAGVWIHAVGEYTESSPHPNPLPKG